MKLKTVSRKEKQQPTITEIPIEPNDRSEAHTTSSSEPEIGNKRSIQPEIINGSGNIVRDKKITDSPELQTYNSKIIGPYEVIEDIGCGNMGLVYKVRHRGADKVMAMKILRSELAADPINVKRFQNELKTTSLLTHPNIIPIYDSGVTDDGRPYFVMEYLDGSNLEEILQSEGCLDLDRFAQFFTQVTEALTHAHENKIIHRDIKPSNIVSSLGDGDVELIKLLDFGIARVYQKATKESTRLTQLGEIIGTPTYMSPEQCLGQKLDERSDIYSLGAVMYECLAGMPPFPGNSTVEVIMGHLQSQPKSLHKLRPDFSIPADLEAIILTCLEKQPGARFQSARELRDELNRFATSCRGRGLFAQLKLSSRRTRARFASGLKGLSKTWKHWSKPLLASTFVATAMLSAYMVCSPKPQMQDYIDKAQLAMLQGHSDQISKNWHAALELANNKHLSNYELANLHEQAGDDIMSQLVKQQNIDSSYGRFEAVNPWNRSDAKPANAPEIEKAGDFYNKALSLYSDRNISDRVRVLDKLVSSEESLQHSKSAADYLARRITLAEAGANYSENNRDIYSSLAAMMEQSGQLSRAEELLKKELKCEQASRNRGEPTQAMVALADFYKRTGNRKKEEAVRRDLLAIWEGMDITYPKSYKSQVAAAKSDLSFCIQQMHRDKL